MKRLAFNGMVYTALTIVYPIIMAMAFGRGCRDFWRTFTLEARLEHHSYIDQMTRDPWGERQRVLREQANAIKSALERRK